MEAQIKHKIKEISSDSVKDIMFIVELQLYWLKYWIFGDGWLLAVTMQDCTATDYSAFYYWLK